MSAIHPTAIVDANAEIDPSSIIGPYCVIEGPVHIGPNNRILAHTYIAGSVQIGARNKIGPSACVGTDPQDYKVVEGTGVEIGSDNHIREFSQIHRSTDPQRPTRLGDGVMLMAGGHVAHDCEIGDGAILTNGAFVSGHCQVGARAILSSPVGIHQHTRIGRLAFLSAGAEVGMDVPPFMVAEGRNAIRAINVVGLRRAGVDAAAREQIKRVYKTLFVSGMTLKSALASIDDADLCAEARELLAFCRAESKRGVMAHARRRTERR